jgi:hypothetical protein
LHERPFEHGHRYVAFADPSGGSFDSFTLAIAHLETETVVIDLLREWPAPFSPPGVVAELAKDLKRYGLSQVTGDRYAGEWVTAAFRTVGISYTYSELTRSEIYLETLPLLNAKKMRLLDDKRSINQLCNLERRTSRAGKDSVDHSPGSHDDLANSLAGAAVNVMPHMRSQSGSMSLSEFFAEGRANATKVWQTWEDQKLKRREQMHAVGRFYY